ncbi:complex I subunit 4 family protein [Raineya orbicola]|jgi:NADH-quinone oxidoreductase subunit M|uniref:Proton-translocating NADH-quinone oxidoreductase, chain M n=1 Tax=Raineya orbicola TaxID=2016530 RepID=A0A2N3IJU9_9BACT|nr:NADH-quinone oxidoreductase subunit M [Raineya orbicola]PKQ70599.1 Proton-translocating NADH-quinone oxidoreductase, chain M [Raineya orbicola]
MTALWLILVPLIASLVVFFIRNEQAKKVALLFSFIELALGLLVAYRFNAFAGMQFENKLMWIPSAGIAFHLGIDGLSIIPIILTTFLVPFIILSAFGNEYEKPNVFYGLILLMQASLIGVFTAQSAFAYYLFWEGALIPVYFIAALWGGANRINITFKFFIYTVFGSLLMLIAFVYMYMQTPANHSDEASVLYLLAFDKTTQNVLFWGLFIAFAIKMPIFPFHTWQPDTYSESPAPATMLLSGIMLKMAIYSLYRWLLPLLPAATFSNAFFVTMLGVIGIVYGAIIAIKQDDMKRILAYSSFSHVGLMSVGLFTFQFLGMQGSLIQMLAHGINIVGLFFVVDIIQRRTGFRNLSDLAGLTQNAPVLTVFFAILLLGSVGLPLTNGFVGEFLLISALVRAYWADPAFALIFGAIAGLTLIFGAVYMIRMFQGVMFGEPNANAIQMKDVTFSEALVLVPLCAMVILMGVYPNLFLKMSEPAVRDLLDFAFQRIR